MKRSASGLALMLALSAVAFADEKPTLESECRAIGESHGVTADKMEDWMNRCMERTREAQRRMDEKGKGHGMDGADHGGTSGKPEEEGR
jgi:hypothetical protein